MTESFHTPLPSISSSLPFTRQPLDSQYPPWSVSPAPAFYSSSSFDRVNTPPQEYSRATPPQVSYNNNNNTATSYNTPPQTYLAPLHTRVPSLEASPPPPAWNYLAPSGSSYSPNSTSGSRSPLRTPREHLHNGYDYDFPQTLPAETYQPKPRSWSEQPLIDVPPRDSISPPRMQSYPHHQPQQQMMPMIGSSYGHGEYMPPPPTFGGGLGAAFPELLPPQQPSGYDSISHSGGMMVNDSDPYHFDPERPHVGAMEFAQALEAYQHIRASLPYIRPASDLYGPPASGQAYRSLMDSANTAIGMLSGQIPARPVGLSHARPMGLAGPEAKRLRMDKDKPATYCRGCGATETPEWRRGPLGPRTLCNACGLVHMKMMRKKKKAEEKAAAAAAAAASNKGI